MTFRSPCAFAVLVFVSGCGLVPTAFDIANADEPTSDSFSVGAAPQSLAQACTDGKAFAKAQCDRSERCATSNAYGFWSWGSGEQCERMVASWYVGIFSLTGTDERIKDCQRELESPTCGPTPSCAELDRDKRREEGVECSSTDDCKVGLACIDESCRARKGEGASCRDSDDCKDGLSCQDDVCKPVVDGATACHYDDDCAVTRDTDAGFFTIFALGDTDRFFCDDATLKCKSAVRDRKQGDRCDRGRLCAAGLYCKGRRLNGEGTCARQIAFGEKCEDTEGCSTCSDGICKDPLAGTCR